MKLHRTTGQPDWFNIEPSRRNAAQRLAAATGGIATPGNLVTIMGLAIVILGLAAVANHHFWLGLASLAIGRLLDLVDGWLAEASGTKSPLGELLDATVDKLGTLATVVVIFWIRITPWWVLLALVLPHLIISIIAINARRRHRPLHPSVLGKLSMAAAWVTLLGLVLLQAIHASSRNIGAVIVMAIFAASFILGSVAALGYLIERD
jgi:phosphatidylglycerophosphate synthase